MAGRTPAPTLELLEDRVINLETKLQELSTKWKELNESIANQGIYSGATGDTGTRTRQITSTSTPVSHSNYKPSCNCVPPCGNKINSVPTESQQIQNVARRKISIGLQTDLEDDPDIFYFAGGRNVGFQTDSSPDYPLLTRIFFHGRPIMITLNNSDSDCEVGSTKESVLTETETNNSNKDITHNNSLNDCESPRDKNVQVLLGEKMHSNSIPATKSPDGWETVKARSCRSKWSSSNSSIEGSNPKKSRHFNEKEVLTQTITRSKIDEEEIMNKEADLDLAIRAEELLEEELRQVEQDFERIEKDNNAEDGEAEGTMTDSEHAPSPDADPEELDDQFFFITVNGHGGGTAREDIPPRDPARILSLKEKLLSPAKKCDSEETLKRYKAKLEKAERNREHLLQSKFNRYVELSERFKALNESTKKLVAERAELIAKAEERRKRATINRSEFLKGKVIKAHDEEAKGKEIQFINLLEAENKRLDYLAIAQGIEERLQSMQEQRRLKLEESAAKAALVIDRQNHIRQDWQSKLKLLKERRRKIDERITREKEERAKERTEIAQEKARDREERISALNSAKQAEKEELKNKIREKQEGSARRHEENINYIRQKAIDLGTPRSQDENNVPATVRICTLCKVIIQSDIHEMQHVRSKPHMDAVRKAEMSQLGASTVAIGGSLVEGFGLKFLADVPQDKLDSEIQPDRNLHKGIKKHTKKLMQKLMDSGLAFETSGKERMPDIAYRGDSLKSKTRKSIMELDRLVSLFENGKGSPSTATTIDRLIANIRKAAVQDIYIKNEIIAMGGLEVGMKVLQCTASDLPIKTKTATVEMIHGFILESLHNGLHVLRGTGICAIMNLCSERWSTLIPDDNRWLSGSPLGGNEVLPTDPYIQAVVALLQALLTYIPDPYNGISKKGSYLTQSDVHSIKLRIIDIIGYLVASGIVDRISVYCGGVRGPVDKQPGVRGLLEVFIDLLVVLVYTLQFCWGENVKSCTINKREPDMTKLLASLEASELAGTVSMSYSLLLHHGAPSRPRTVDALSSSETPPPPGDQTTEVVKCTLCLINAMAKLDILALQNVLGSETISLQFRHIASQLLWQVVPHRSVPLMRRLLNELIISIGNFTVGNLHNQATIQSGQTPTVLQLLCTLPKEFFSDSKLKHNFLPTLLAATRGCPENQGILIQNNIDVEILENYLHSAEGKSNVIIKRMISSGC